MLLMFIRLQNLSVCSVCVRRRVKSRRERREDEYGAGEGMSAWWLSMHRQSLAIIKNKSSTYHRYGRHGKEKNDN